MDDVKNGDFWININTKSAWEIKDDHWHYLGILPDSSGFMNDSIWIFTRAAKNSLCTLECREYLP